MTAPTLDLGNLLVHLNADISQFEKKMRKAEQRMKKAADNMTHLGRQMTLRVTLPIVAMGAASVKAFASFDDAMIKSLAIMSDITPQLRKEMEDLALSISNEGITSATDLGKSYFFLASAGLDAQQSMAALGAVEAFAVAGAFDMATATDLATDAQSALGLTVKDAQQNLVNMTRVTDALIGANTLANASTKQFALSLTSQAGPAMKAYGIELEEGLAVLAAYADQGIKAQNSGNLFSRMLRLMTKGFLDNEKVWKRFKIDIFEASGKLKPMATIVGDLSNALGEMSTKQKISTLAMLGFQARSQQAILPLLGLQDRIAGYNEALLKMKGITEEVYQKQLKSFSSQMKILWNNIKNAGIVIGKILAPTLLSLNEKIKSLAIGWRGLSLNTQKLIIGFALLAASVGPVLLVFGSFIKLLLLVKIAALAGAASIGILMGSILALYAAIGSFALGTYLANEYKWVAEAGNKTIISLWKGWERLKNVVELSGAAIKLIWSGVTKSIINSFSFVIVKVAQGLSKLEDMINKLPFIESINLGAAAVEKWAASMTEGMVTPQVEFRKAVEEANKKLEDQLAMIDSISAEAQKEIDIKFARKKDGTSSLDEMIQKIKEILVDIDNDVQEKTKNWQGWFNDWAGSALDTFSNMSQIASDAMDSVADSLTDLVMRGKADFNTLANAVLEDITRMIIKAQLARALMSFMPGIIPTAPGVTTPVTVEPVAVQHAGGMIGQVNSSRFVASNIFNNAPRFHNGGLAANEVPIIAEKGERILSKKEVAEGVGRDKRSSTVNITVQAIDAQGTYQFLNNNKRAIASMLQGTIQNNHPSRRVK